MSLAHRRKVDAILEEKIARLSMFLFFFFFFFLFYDR